MAETPQGSNNAGNVIGWLEKILSLVKKAGIQNIILSILLLFIVIVVGQVAFNPAGFIKRIETVQHEQHQRAIEKRIDATSKIRETMLDFKGESKADRVFVLEAHNGGQNLNNLPFLYVDLTYAEPRASASWLLDEYINVRLSRYPCALKLYDETYIMLPVEDIKPFDPELYYRLQKDGVQYLCMMMLYSGKEPIGAIGGSYSSITNVPDPQTIKKALTKYSTTISGLLSLK